jgi:2-polyprenyl-3-methyl-5-hydroxy-6-metoxy-1,4-benzoquinol methylase
MNVFDVDVYRQKLAASGKLSELLDTYKGEYPEISNISTAEKWDNLSALDCIPEIRIKRLERVVDLIDINKKILDIGVGWGDIVPLLTQHNKTVNYTGIDFSEEIVKKLHDKYPNQRFMHNTVDTLDDNYDCVLVLEVLEHIVPTKLFGFLKSVNKVLRDKGTLMVTVPLKEDLKINTLVCGSCGSLVNRMGHVRSYSPDLIKKELEIAGFIVTNSEFVCEGYYGFKGAIKRRLRNIAGRLIGPSTFKQVTPSCVILKCRKSVEN